MGLVQSTTDEDDQDPVVHVEYQEGFLDDPSPPQDVLPPKLVPSIDALHRACAVGSTNGVLERLVVEDGYDANSVDEHGATPLHLAAFYGHKRAVVWLIEKGAAKSFKDSGGHTPADLARESGFEDIADLIEAAEIAALPFHRDRRRVVDKEREARFVELDRAQSKIVALKASEKRAKMELEAEIAERVKLFRALVSGRNGGDVDALDSLADMRIQLVEYKKQRDALAAEMKLVEDAVGDFETFVTGEQRRAKPKSKNDRNDKNEETIDDPSPSARLRACLRRI